MTPEEREVLAPFVRIVKGIAPNWPGECCLRIVREENGQEYLSYHGVNEENTTLPRIEQWRALLKL